MKKWIDTPELKKNEKFICDWHYFIKEFQEKSISSGDEQYMKKVSMGILNEFYVRPYEPDRDFYEQFYERLETLKKSDF